MEHHKNQIAVGEFTGTGAAITIQLGFQPRAVTLLNTSGNARLEWTEQMGAGYGHKTADSGAGTTDISLISTGGVSKYAGAAEPVALTGTCAVAAGSPVVTGTSTLFSSELSEGDFVNVNGVTRQVLSIASATSMTMREDYDATASGKVGYNISGRKEGFTIGTDADINASAEVVRYIAYR